MAHQIQLDQLPTLLERTLSPQDNIRKDAERNLTEVQKLPGFSLQILNLVASVTNPNIRLSAAVIFKNFVKHNWDANSDSAAIEIGQSDRNTIKTHLVQLMCEVPVQVQKQCSESISLIAAVDFPMNWQSLLPELISKFDSQNMQVLNGVLLSANSILKSFRYVERSDALYQDILFALKYLQEPILKLFQKLGKEIDTLAGNAVELKGRFQALCTLCRIFFSLNYQDLPEYFEDHISEWMTEFAKYLTYTNPLLVDTDEENEPSPIDRLQAAIVENLNLYGKKDEEPFLPFLQNFTQLVWTLLLGVTSYEKHDILATTSIRFLSSLVAKQMHRSLFQEEATLRQIVAKIIIPNVNVREVDVEKFEDDAPDFILGDMEGSDTESRRKCSQELLRAMCLQFDNETTAICSEHITSMLGQFSKDPVNSWRAKDVAIYLMLAVAIKAESAMGVSLTNEKINVMEFFASHIVPELQDADHSSRPMVKATALKFVTTFRCQFSIDHLKVLIQLLIGHLGSESIVVHTYAAIGIEKILTLTHKNSAGKKVPKIGKIDIQQFFESLFTGLFRLVDNELLAENEYVMKCIMRSLSTAKEDIVPVTATVLDKLTCALARVSKNPRNPHFNHYMFESIAVLVKHVCSVAAQHTEAFEKLLFPPFQTVLSANIEEFSPYVFQILSQLLEYRPMEGGLGEAYTMLLDPLLHPVLWERKGNVPALTRLLQAYLNKGGVSEGKVDSVLGVFQKLVASSANEVSGFDLLGTIIQAIPRESMLRRVKPLFQVLLARLQHKKTPRFLRLITQFFALFVGKYDSSTFIELVNSIQTGLGFVLLSNIWLPRLESDTPKRIDAKVQIVGLTKLIGNTPLLLTDINGQRIWSQCLSCVLKILISPDSNISASSDVDNEENETEISYDPTYSRLHFASIPKVDPFAEVKDPAQDLVKSLHVLSTSQPGVVSQLIQQASQSDPKFVAYLQSMFQKANLSFV
mmetsp:Transcript_61393/g.73848  ORF Transcript_61393/g.73848 Transcript_61393/m.73848 type:complete len:977 (+) Transcript_61393:114-3044(+)|eukprot:CAMPEP_0194373450 /NCGR_PEP_ID=MMETSP0174-20130528/21914_1 /TAXON_ID=216777 /ORGANISM="Proboscia alata, Strain PI-D3" /LENGTH=976 /DNA_ID=CAMNT_0039152543 /DNA_START=45 /DNA_END=2975 /DNA_ORIENTATION=-